MLALSVIVGTGIVLAQTTTIDIQVAPATLNLNAEGKWVTVHTNIPYSDVNRTTLELNDIPVAWTKADDCGNLVAKFNQAAIADTVDENDDVTLTLTGKTNDGTSFEGTDTIRVINKGK